jgi:hypothetical protein
MIYRDQKIRWGSYMKKWIEQLQYRWNGPVIETEDARLAGELRTAREEWIVATEQLNYVLDHDQIDYAIYALEAKEKRYEMLLRQAKKARLNLKDEKTGKVWEGSS